MGKMQDAEQKYREVLALSPDDDQALHGLQALGKRY
jgi:predicted TPR repeat methyltransferase